MKKYQKLSIILMVVFSFVLAFGFISCDTDTVDNLKIQASNLMSGIKAKPVNTVALDGQFRSAAANFSLDLFKAAISDSENSLISPTSVLLALAMTANGADGDTLSQMEQVLGRRSDFVSYKYGFIRRGMGGNL